VVARLRAAGAVLVGKTAQHELGLGATGISPHETRTPRNPHDPAHAPGGSSSGSAVAVALGLVPLAVGTDAGG
jgi:Asp-tRNA(Asn)/Glu-tRNA(Gln) amidotransferase A subunit family amidase